MTITNSRPGANRNSFWRTICAGGYSVLTEDFPVPFPQFQGKCQGKTRKDGARPLSSKFLCCSMYFCIVLCIFCFVSFSVLFECICVLYDCHRVATQLHLNISYHIISYIHRQRSQFFLEKKPCRLVCSYRPWSLNFQDQAPQSSWILRL
jgi:hypothetical protein